MAGYFSVQVLRRSWPDGRVETHRSAECIPCGAKIKVGYRLTRLWLRIHPFYCRGFKFPWRPE